MAARDVLKNFNLFVDGRGYAGQVKEYTAPDLTLLTEDTRAGGMDGPMAIPLGMEALTCSFSLNAYDADTISQWGVSVGGVVPLTIRGALESYDGSVKGVIHLMRGRITSIARGTWTPGAIAPLTVTMRPDFYSETIDGVVISLIDIENMIRIIGGVDQLATQRAALGI